MEEVAEYLPSSTTKHHIKKRTILIYQGEVPRQAYIVLGGSFKVYHLTSNGEEQVVGFKTIDDIFPETWILGKTNNALYYYEALEDSEVLTIERQVFLELVETNSDLKDKLFDYIARGYTGHLMQILALEQSRADEKLPLILYYLMFRYGKETKPDAYVIDIQLTHSLIASLTGLTRETTTTELGRLKRKSVIFYDAKQFVIYRHALENMLGDDSISDIQLR